MMIHQLKMYGDVEPKAPNQVIQAERLELGSLFNFIPRPLNCDVRQQYSGTTVIITFLVSLHNIEIKENLGRGDKLSDTAFISNDTSLFDKIIPSNFISAIGFLELESLKRNRVFLYSTEEIADDVDPELYLINQLYGVQSFLSIIWLFQDNSIAFEIGFVFHSSKGKSGICSNFLSTTSTMATGTKEKTILGREELRKMRSFYIKMQIDTYFVKEKYKYENRESTHLLKSNTRIEIAHYHILGARAASDLGLKISNYCSSLESLFSTSQAELSHQLAERLAFFIGSDYANRLSIYKKTKQAYTIRSKIVHGATIKNSDLEKMTQSSVFLDDCLRQVIAKLYSDKNLRKIFESKDESLNNYMLNLIFGGNC